MKMKRILIKNNLFIFFYSSKNRSLKRINIVLLSRLYSIFLNVFNITPKSLDNRGSAEINLTLAN